LPLGWRKVLLEIQWSSAGKAKKIGVDMVEYDFQILLACIWYLVEICEPIVEDFFNDMYICLKRRLMLRKFGL